MPDEKKQTYSVSKVVRKFNGVDNTPCLEILVALNGEPVDSGTGFSKVHGSTHGNITLPDGILLGGKLNMTFYVPIKGAKAAVNAATKLARESQDKADRVRMEEIEQDIRREAQDRLNRERNARV